MLINNPNEASESFLAATFLSTHGETLILFDNFNSFGDERLADFKLKVYGVAESEVPNLQKKYKDLSNVVFSKYISKTELGKELAISEIGILASSADPFSKFYTNPLKFHEYVA